jgi:hypothetical protein
MHKQATLILLNGPNNSGKTKAVEYLKKSMGVTIQERQCKEKLHELTIDFFNVDQKWYFAIYNDKIKKEIPRVEFAVTYDEYKKLADIIPLPHKKESNAICMLSLRQAMIYVSEVVIKPEKGRDYFGVERVNKIQENEVAIDDSAGFIEELYPAIRSLGQENILLIRVHGRKTDESDSRNYIPDGVIENTVDLTNDGTLTEWVESVKNEVTTFLDTEKPTDTFGPTP